MFDKIYLPTKQPCRILDEAITEEGKEYLIEHQSGGTCWDLAINVEDMDIVKDKGLNLEFYGDY